MLTQLSTSHIVNKNHDKSVKKLQHRDSWPVKNMTRQYFYVQCLFAYVYETGVPVKEKVITSLITGVFGTPGMSLKLLLNAQPIKEMGHL